MSKPDREFRYAPGLVDCWRCNGTGTYPSSLYNGVCFKCDGHRKQERARVLTFREDVSEERREEIRAAEDARLAKARNARRDKKHEANMARLRDNRAGLEAGDPELAEAFEVMDHWNEAVEDWHEARQEWRREQDLDHPLDYIDAKDGPQLDLPRPANLLLSVAGKAINYAKVSAKQRNLLLSLVKQITDDARKRAEEAATARPVPNGRQVVEGEVLTVDYRDSYYGGAWKMLVKCDGYKLWGTVPNALRDDNLDLPPRGTLVRFTATLERSGDDENFGFYKRPSKAVRVTSEEPANAA